FRMLGESELLARFLWTGFFAFATGLVLYYTLWTPRNASAKVVATTISHDRTTAVSPTPPPSTPKLPPTLRDLYATDFPGFAHFDYGGELHAKAEDGHLEKVKVSYAVYMDFAANSRFIAVYIASSPASYYACTKVPDFYNEILDEADKV